MFCTKCGKELHDGDRFCGNCGAEVRAAKHSKYDDVVFNPPFRMEAQRRTEEILKSTESQTGQKKREAVSFDWNLDGFPAAQPRKTEEVDFNWDSVVERRNGTRQVKVEKIQPEQELFFAGASEVEEPTKEVPRIRENFFVSEEPVKPVVEEEPSVIPEITELEAELDTEEPVMTIEDLERELFGEEETIPQAPEYKPADDRFYTYNQKFDAFQELLEKEKERLREMESGSSELKNMDYTWVGEVFPEIKKEPEVVAVVAPSLTMSVEIDKINEAIAALEAEAETEATAEDPAGEEPETEAAVSEEVPEVQEEPEESAEEPEVPAEPEIPEEESTPSKTKLRYSDIFPRDLVGDSAGDGGTAETEKTEAETGTPVAAPEAEKPAAPPKREKPTISSIYDDLDEEDEPKKHVFAKIVIGILLVLILAEGIIIGAKFLAPDSKLSLWANDLMMGVLNMVMGGGDDSQTDDEDEEGKEGLYSNAEKIVYMDSLIAEASAEMKTIGEAVYNDELTFDTLESYSFEEIPDADDFVDADWYEDSDGSAVTYGEKIMESLIRYYDSWQAVNTDESLVGINSLEFGEIKTGDEGFYVLCRVTYAGADGGSVEKYHTVYLRISDKAMIINEIKEGNL
ncbi:MAG: zinc ribbon domain-containing protein [Firmicutes bacterium]|nr:zinc ribbon domain-containing protein [Bacillota bacterium]